MELKRKPFQGVFNIIRFNWHFYLAASLVIISGLYLKGYLNEQIQPFIFWFALVTTATLVFSLVVSFYIYDLSKLYQIKWLPKLERKSVLNINAGFDETSKIINSRLYNCDLKVCDFYNPLKHTEISIKRARKAYPPFKNTIQVTTNKLPFTSNFFDYSLAVLSAHEIRDEEERVTFFRELHRVTKSTGRVFVTEHLRDWKNFVAYTVGAFHFHSKWTWLKTFEKSNFKVQREFKITPFITTFILVKNGDAL